MWMNARRTFWLVVCLFKLKLLLGASIAEMLKETSESVTRNSGYIFDDKTGLYFDKDSGYYYDPVMRLSIRKLIIF